MTDVIIDANILIHNDDQLSPYHEECVEIIEAGLSGRLELYIPDRALLRYYRILTSTTFRRRLNRARIIDNLEFYKNHPSINILYSTTNTYDYIFEIVSQRDVIGSQVDDTYILAMAMENSITNLVTYNTKDFYSSFGVRIITPKLLLANYKK